MSVDARMHIDHVGSLLRPQALKDAFAAHGRGELPAATLAAVQDAAIRDVLARQEAIGLPVVTDGEYRRLNWQVSFSEVQGWDQWKPAWDAYRANPTGRKPGELALTRGEDAVVSFRTPVTARLRLERNFPLQEFGFAAAHAHATVKATIMGPDRVAQMCDIDASPDYSDLDELLSDVATVQREMVAELLDAGCRYIQLDEPSYTGYVDPPTRERMLARGENPSANLDRAVAATNAVMAGFHDRATFAVHICRGNRAGMWHREGSYDAIAERLFAGLDAERLLLEYDSERAGGFEPLRFVPAGRTVVLGLITTKSSAIESSDALISRVEDASHFVAPANLAISPQCGFASGMAGNDLTEDQQWRKLEQMLETARLIWND